MYSLGEIARIVDGKLTGDASLQIRDLAYDSRKLFRSSYSLFFALQSGRADGHSYLEAVKHAGVKAVMVSRKPTIENLNFILVKDTLQALQKLAAYHRSKFNIPVIGITGSNGKTIVKEWLNTLLQKECKILKSPRSYNSQLGVALSVWPLGKEHELAIIEAGISKPGEMKRLEAIIKPDIGVFTHLGDAHSSYFGSLEEKLEEKLLLFKNSRIIIANGDQPLLFNALKKTGKETFFWGFEAHNSLQIVSLDYKDKGTQALFRWNNTSYSFFIPFRDIASIHNVFSALSAALQISGDPESLIRTAEKLKPLDMRLQQVEGLNGNNLILDYYNADLESFKVSLDFLARQNEKRPKTVILSDILQSQLPAETLYGAINELILDQGITKLVGIGSGMMLHQHLFEIEDKDFYPDTASFLGSYPFYSLSKQGILLKGARDFAFEKIAERLSYKTHQTVLEVNMSRLQHNIDQHRNLLPEKVKIMAMVKAFGYGAGSYQLAKLLEQKQVDYFGVAYTDEAIALRQAGIQTPIMVLNPDFSKIATLLEYNIEPAIYSLEVLRKLINYTGESPLNIHVEFDTGMHRLGLEEEDSEELIHLLQTRPFLQLASVYSHLAVADEPKKDPFTLKQIQGFHNICNMLKSKLGYDFIRHISNTAGIQRFNNKDFDMVRLGIGMYGVAMDPGLKNLLLPVGTFKSYIAQIKNVKAGEGVSYGLHDAAEKERRIAVVAVGYADGYNRKFSCGQGSFLIHGKKAPVVGNVCMDMTMCDISDIPCKEGDEVIIFGDEPRVENLAEILETIPYEVLTSVSERVQRIFYQE